MRGVHSHLHAAPARTDLWATKRLCLLLQPAAQLQRQAVAMAISRTTCAHAQCASLEPAGSVEGGEREGWCGAVCDAGGIIYVDLRSGRAPPDPVYDVRMLTE